MVHHKEECVVVAQFSSSTIILDTPFTGMEAHAPIPEQKPWLSGDFWGLL